ncbi:aspartyl/glutamyl-tRNA amidotransferase subunit A [Patescibacteria group bacterium]|nr:aspartyl/glutamyl-tRNA amidotransferase subunit A [Patescibacteria group bacterium]
MKLNELTLCQALKKLREKEISHDELYAAIHTVIEEKNPGYNIYLTVNHEALRDAKQSLSTPLAGVPVAVKDNFLTCGLATTASSKMLTGFMPPYESTVTERLKNSGGVIIGKTNMDAWAHGSSTETSDFGVTKNPRNPEYLPGGSSGGSAAAIAADMAIAALGTETAGSIRQPASWCGVVGFKPTYGRVSRRGVVAMASSTDSPGPLGKTVEDCAVLAGLIAGHDVLDATTTTRNTPEFTKHLKDGVKGMRIGVCYVDHPGLSGTPAATAVTEAAKVFEHLGASVESVPISQNLSSNAILNPDYAIGVYTVVQRGEVSSNLARYDGIRYGATRDVFGEEARRRIMLGTFTLSSLSKEHMYVYAQKVRHLIIQNYHELYKKFDLLISPTSPGYAQKIGATAGNPLYGELEDMLLEASSIAGLTGISVPCMKDPETQLFLGLNITGDQWQEEKVLQAAYAFEQATAWNPWVQK